MYLDFTLLGILVAFFLAVCAAIGAVLAYHKRRSPVEGMLLGFLLGPFGVMIERRHPCLRRPPVDPHAWHSLRSMMDYQENNGGALKYESESLRG